jgi:Brp/Blh family beta-carotene 15,15'-monooxygenase
VLLGTYGTWFLAICEPFLVLGMMLVLGLPHGATDHGLFRALRMKGSKLKFFLLYGLVIGCYGLIWYVFPLLAFAIFMLLSIYHFGQSNWADVSYGKSTMGRLHYLLWGGGVLLTPILLHGGQAIDIVAVMTGSTLTQPTNALQIIGILGGLNVAMICLLWFKGILTGKRFAKEFIGYGLLMAMFFTNSLLLGFTVYFVCWHSLSSVRDQLRFFALRLSPDLRHQLRYEIGGTIVGALAFCLYIWLGPGPAAALKPNIIGGVFVFISLLTLPHMLLIEQLYNNWSPAEGKIRVPESETTKQSASNLVPVDHADGTSKHHSLNHF